MARPADPEAAGGSGERVDNTAIAEETPIRTNRRIWALLTASVAVAIIVAGLILVRTHSTGGERIDSLAVLPLQNLSGDPEQEFFANGMTEALITELAHIKALRVVSRTSIVRYRGTKKAAPEIANELNVQAILEGAVERAGDRIRISARLIRASNDRSVWAESYDRDVWDVLRLQAEVARSIARGIQVELTPDERARFAAARQVVPDAYQFYLKGRYFWRSGRAIPSTRRSNISTRRSRRTRIMRPRTAASPIVIRLLDFPLMAPRWRRSRFNLKPWRPRPGRSHSILTSRKHTPRWRS